MFLKKFFRKLKIGQPPYFPINMYASQTPAIIRPLAVLLSVLLLYAIIVAGTEKMKIPELPALWERREESLSGRHRNLPDGISHRE